MISHHWQPRKPLTPQTSGKVLSQTRMPKDTIEVDLYTTEWDHSYATKPLRTNPPHWGDIAHRAPVGRLEQWIWRKRLWFESTFILIVLEPWEKLLVCEYSFTLIVSCEDSSIGGLPPFSLGTVFALLAVFFAWSVYYYLPAQLQFIYTRTKYYVLGEEGAQAEALTFILRQATSSNK